MKLIVYISLFLISFQGVAQSFADKEFYLVDSLVLEELTPPDRQLLDSCLTFNRLALPSDFYF